MVSQCRLSGQLICARWRMILVPMIMCAALVMSALFTHAPSSTVMAAEQGEGASEPLPLAGRNGRVWVVPLTGTIDLGLASFVRRAVDDAIDANAAAILVEVNTFGGRVDAATEIRDALIGAGIPTIAFVRERAWSAGALITLACDWIWMAPGASVGAAEPRPADPKTISALRAEFEAMAERRGRPAQFAAAMVDANVEIEGVSAAGEILTLSAGKAQEHGIADGIASSRSDVLQSIGLDRNAPQHASLNWGERVARFLTDPVVSQILLTLGFLGLLAEVTAPGWGIPGIAGVAALGLFFGGRYFIGLVGWEVMGLFVLGLFLLILELFVVTGFGFAGLGGLAALFASLYLAFGDAELAVRSIGTTILTTGVGAYILWRSGRRFGVWRRLILSSKLSTEQGYVAPQDLKRHEGQEGRTLTALRPAGAILIGDDRIDAVSEGSYVESGKPVVVVRVEGTRVVVREVSTDT